MCCRLVNLISFNKIAKTRLAPLSRQAIRATTEVSTVTPTKIARKRNLESSLRGKSALRLLRVELRAHDARTRHYRARGTSIDVFPGPGGEGESKGINVDFWQERIGINGKFARLNGLQMFSGPGGTIATPESRLRGDFSIRIQKNQGFRATPTLYPTMGAPFILPFLPLVLPPRSLRPPHLPVFALVKNDSPSTSRHIWNIFGEYE